MTEEFYASIYSWCLDRLKESSSKPIVIGVNGAQGAGKTTLTNALVDRFSQAGKKALTLSIDDFYLTRKEQQQLAESYPYNPYLQQRGYPGTHDVLLGDKVLKQLRRVDGSLSIPRYAKSAHAGKGDRDTEDNWTKVSLPLDIIFFEGWMLGFQSVDSEELPNASFIRINELLKSYETWWAEMDAFIFLDAKSYDFTLKWRVEAEEKMKASGKSGMSREEVEEYVSKFQEAYRTYIPGLRSTVGQRWKSLHVEIGEDRMPTVLSFDSL